MTCTHDDLRPLLRGHYTTAQAMWQALGRLAEFVTNIVGRRVGRRERDVFVSEVLADLAARAERRQGLPCDVPEAKLGAWFAGCVANSLRDVQRKQQRHAARFELTAEVDEPAAEDAVEVAPEPGPAWRALESEDCPPSYRLTLKAWYAPPLLAQGDLEAMAARAQQGKSDQASGLVRAIAPSWALLRQIRMRWPDGIARRRPAIDRFAFTVRADSSKYTTWASDKKAVKAARETVGKWHVRGRTWLRDRMEAR